MSWRSRRIRTVSPTLQAYQGVRSSKPDTIKVRYTIVVGSFDFAGQFASLTGLLRSG
jgi:hypothetical protein